MAKPKLFYRVLNVDTGRYYTGKAVWVTNPKYDNKYDSKYNAWYPEQSISRDKLQKYSQFYTIGNDNKYREISSYNKKLDFTAEDMAPWMRNRACYWSEEGKMYDTRKGAELVLSSLTRTSKKLRSNKVDFLLNAPPEAAKYRLVACKYDIIEVPLEDEVKILQPSKDDQQKVNE